MVKKYNISLREIFREGPGIFQ